MTNALRSSDDRIGLAVRSFAAYTDELQRFISNIDQLEKREAKDQVVGRILNGEAAAALKRLVPLAARKEAGLFFTSHALAQRVANHLRPMLEAGYKLLDPACGAGNLFLACCRHFPTGQNLGETLAMWSERLLGYDFYPEFIRAARLRLALLAMNMHPQESNMLGTLYADEVFRGLKVGHAFRQPRIPDETCVAVNPPFGHIWAPIGCKWGRGKIQAAALFLERLLHMTCEGQHVVAILPDVLRSGSRYENWRGRISSLCSSIQVELAGRFDASTDVDVFIMHVVTGGSDAVRCMWPKPLSRAAPRHCVVSDFFDVRVGPVVPHRDPLQGSSHPYIHARTALAWHTVDQIREERRYKGTVYSPPFLVVRRTSSPSDKHRCVATIVNEQRDVAVENHLLVLQPHDKSLASCEKLLEVLKLRETDEWLNGRIRCRHLTVTAIRELPCCAIELNKP